MFVKISGLILKMVFVFFLFSKKLFTPKCYFFALRTLICFLIVPDFQQADEIFMLGCFFSQNSIFLSKNF